MAATARGVALFRVRQASKRLATIAGTRRCTAFAVEVRVLVAAALAAWAERRAQGDDSRVCELAQELQAALPRPSIPWLRPLPPRPQRDAVVSAEST